MDSRHPVPDNEGRPPMHPDGLPPPSPGQHEEREQPESSMYEWGQHEEPSHYEEELEHPGESEGFGGRMEHGESSREHEELDNPEASRGIGGGMDDGEGFRGHEEAFDHPSRADELEFPTDSSEQDEEIPDDVWKHEEHQDETGDEVPMLEGRLGGHAESKEHDAIEEGWGDHKRPSKETGWGHQDNWQSSETEENQNSDEISHEFKSTINKPHMNLPSWRVDSSRHALPFNNQHMTDDGFGNGQSKGELGGHMGHNYHVLPLAAALGGLITLVVFIIVITVVCIRKRRSKNKYNVMNNDPKNQKSLEFQKHMSDRYLEVSTLEMNYGLEKGSVMPRDPYGSFYKLPKTKYAIPNLNQREK